MGLADAADCYIYANNTKAYDHFKKQGATLQYYERPIYIEGCYDSYYPDGGLIAIRNIYIVSNHPACKSGQIFHKYLKANNLLLP